MNIPTLAEHYRRLGLTESAWHIGPEHPGIEELGLRVLASTGGARILELGVQSGGFAVPVILAVASEPGFSYVGVDNLAYANAVPLRLVGEYLQMRGVTAPVRLIEGDSTVVLRTAARESFDLILVDHYKPKYPLDLHYICARNLLSASGAILLHDVLGSAADQWRVCTQVCKAHGYTWTIDANVSQGAAIVRRGSTRGSVASQQMITLEVNARWMAHATVLRTRRAIGRALRAAGLRR
jgi:hypothetical protein